MRRAPVLICEGVTKKFKGLVAVNDFSLEVKEGEIHGLIGPNGAGKTTFFNVITGIYPANSGSIYFQGEDITNLDTSELVRKGIGRTWQIPRPFENMTVHENIRSGALFGSTENEDVREITERTIELLNLEDIRDRDAAELTIGNKKLMGLGRAVATNPTLLLLDELVSGLNPTESSEAVEAVGRLKDETHVTIFEIEHDMEVIMEISDVISVIHEGRNIAEGTPDEIRANDKVIEAYLGEEYAGSR